MTDEITEEEIKEQRENLKILAEEGEKALIEHIKTDNDE